MPNNLKFPPSVEIKRAIAAAIRAGVEIGSIEIHPDKITIQPRDPKDEKAPGLGTYDLWKMSHGQDSQNVRHVDEKSDAPPTKPRK